MLPIKEIETLVKERTKNVLSVSHDFDHLKRTAIGAKWFAEIFGCTEKEQQAAYIAGLVHDFERPLSEVEHKYISLNEAKKFLGNFLIENKTKNKILKMVEEHRYVSDLSLTQPCLFLSDKLLEQSGAFIVFRRCTYIGECLDFKDVPFFDAMVSHWKTRMNKFKPEKFHKKVSKLANYQYDWQIRFFKALEINEDWAITIAKECYGIGQNHNKTLVNTIKNIKVEKDGIDFKKEALLYIEGKKFNEFKELVSKS